MVAAETEHRSLANVLEVSILEYVKSTHIAVPVAAKEKQLRED